jgi:hypothetical protein
MNIFGALSIFALYVLSAAALTNWRRAEDWGGMSFSRRVFLGVSVTWKWWLLFSVALLFHDAVLRYGSSVPGDIVIVGIALVMAIVFALLRRSESRRL